MRFSVLLSVCVVLASSGLAQELYTLEGESASQLGFSVNPAGDVNDDGSPDFICGRPYWQLDVGGSPTAGAVVYSAADGAELLVLPDSEESGAGFAVDGVGDVDGDGHDDVVVGAPADDSTGVVTGAARVYSGDGGAQLFAFFGTPSSFFGHSVAGVGDVNADGVPDIAVGARTTSTLGSNRGRFEVFSGLDGSVLLTVDGEQDGDHLGQVSRAGDVNGDGHADVFASAPWADDYGPEFGLARVYSGLDGTILREFGGSASFDAFGVALACAGDLDGDGVEDLLVGIPGGSTVSRGEARAFSGADGALLFSVEGDTPDDHIGRSVAAAGDVDGDGTNDVIVGGPSASYVDEWAGIARVHSGDDGAELFEWHGEESFDQFGGSVCGTGDVDGDGLAELVVGAPGSSGEGPFSGSVRAITSVTQPTTSYCFADAASFACPCGNQDPLAGCANSTGAGALLTGTGSQSLRVADYVLTSSGLPANTIALLFKGTAQVSLPFGDGRRCVGGHTRRILVFQADAAGGATLAVEEGEPVDAVPGTTDDFQVWYRDVGGPCGSMFNLSNGVEVPWLL